MFSKLPDWVKEVAVGVVAIAFVSWAGWLSFGMFGISRLETQLTGLTGRIDRISDNLPTELARASQEALKRQIKTAMALGTPFFEDGEWTRSVILIDGANQYFKVIRVQVAGPDDLAPIDKLLGELRRASNDTLTFSALERDADLYDVPHVAMPRSIDLHNSLLLNMDFRAVNRILFDATVARGKPELKDLSPRPVT